MCGIAGIVGAGAPATVLDRMSRAISHRGPDDAGIWQEGDVAFVHRRLSILDLAGGHQPMLSADGRFVVVFNGEIYNYPELRQDLETEHGIEFRTGCDTEVLLHLHALTRGDFVTRLRGMFAFAIWDRADRTLFMARDHLGQKPLFYADSPGGFTFGSEIKAILAATADAPRVDLQTLWHHTSLRFCPGDRTLFEGIRKLPPGHRLWLSPGEPPRIERYWSLSFHREKPSFEEAVERCDRLLADSVRAHLLADVPVGAFLSGGVDSSTVAALAAGASSARLSTFTVGSDDSDFSELPYARTAADVIGSDHHEFRVHTDLMLMLPDIIWHMEEPADPHAVGLYQLSERTRQHVKVALGGDGGDELFGGYTRFTRDWRMDAYRRLPVWLRRRVMEPMLGFLPDSYAYYSVATKAKWLHETSFVTGAHRHYLAMTFFRFGPEHRYRLFAPATRRTVEEEDSVAWIAEHYDAPEGMDEVGRMLYAEQMTRMPEHYLLIGDRMSMAHGLEARVPLVDVAVAEFSASLPSEYKVGRGELKRVLRAVGARYFDRSFIDRTKQGFGFPMARWFAGPLAEFLSAALADARVLDTGWLDRSFVNELFEQHRARRADHNFRLWMILNLEVWYRLFICGDDREVVRGWIASMLPAPAAAAHAMTAAG
jgi:asparagine synthase (glutamine-hydrolysing)